MAQRNNRRTTVKKAGSKSSPSFQIALLVVLALIGLGVWLYYQPEDAGKKQAARKESTEKRALEILKQHPTAEVFDVQEEPSKKKSPPSLP